MGNSFTVNHSTPTTSKESISNTLGYSYRPRKPVVIIVGGGYAGLTAAKHLDQSNQFNIILIERRDYFYFNIPCERALVQTDLIEQITIPYDKLQSESLFIVKGEVINISNNNIILSGHEKTPLSYDYCILATGSTSTAFPAINSNLSIYDAHNRLRELSSYINQAYNITIVGAGATGVQMAGEIGHEYKNKKHVTLISAHDYFVGERFFTAKFQSSVKQQLEKLGIRLIMNERLLISEECIAYCEKNNTNYVFGTQIVQTNTGRNIATDLVIFCTGGKLDLNSNFSIFNNTTSNNTNNLDPDIFLPNGRLKVNYYFQFHKYSNIFAVGDIAGIECKKAINAITQAEAVANNIINLHNKKPLIPYIPCSRNPRTAVTIGRKGGVIQVHDIQNNDGKVVGARFTAWLKSKNLFCDKAFQAFGYKYNSCSIQKNTEQINQTLAARKFRQNSTLFLTQVNKLSSIFKITELQSSELLLGVPSSSVQNNPLITDPVEISKLSMKREISDFDAEVVAAQTRATYTDEQGRKLFENNNNLLSPGLIPGSLIRDISDVPVINFQEEPKNNNITNEIHPLENNDDGFQYEQRNTGSFGHDGHPKMETIIRSPEHEFLIQSVTSLNNNSNENSIIINKSNMNLNTMSTEDDSSSTDEPISGNESPVSISVVDTAKENNNLYPFENFTNTNNSNSGTSLSSRGSISSSDPEQPHRTRAQRKEDALIEDADDHIAPKFHDMQVSV